MKKKLAVPAAAVAAIAAIGIPSAPAATTVKVDDDVFKPGSLSVSKGTSVRWRWVGDDPHNVVVKKGPVKFKSSIKDSGTFTRKMTKKGTYTIVCTIHPGMDMTLKVR